jgi:RNA polymerase sigma factor (sigma-70 family)
MKVTDFPMLLVEDDPVEIVHVQEALAQANLVNPLRIVHDGRKAIAYLSGQDEYADRDSHPFPSLVLLDLTLSDPSGLEVLAWIRTQQNCKNLPVILLTSSAADQGNTEPAAAALGVSSYLSKPVECEPLLEMMKSIGMYWMILDNSRPGAGQPGVSVQGRHVLVVDHDADFLRSIGEAMRRRVPPFAVDPALDAADALRRLARNSLSAIVYERGIDESEDFGFLSKVRALNADIPVIVLGAERDEAFSVRAIQKGLAGVLLKQVRQDHFSDQLHALLLASAAAEISVVPAASGTPPAQDSTAGGRESTAAAPDSAVVVPSLTHRTGGGTGRRQDTEILGNQINFQNTSWDLVRAAPKTEALDALIRIYWKPLYFFVRQRGIPNEEAKDIVQEFLASALEHGMIPKADPLRGRFRTFLLAALTNFMKDRHRSSGRQKRGGGHVPMSLDLELGEPRYARAVNTGEAPETIIDRAWAKGLLGQCILELVGKPSHLQAFELQMQGVDYVTIAKATGLTETAAKTAVHRLRVRLRGIIRSHLSLEKSTDSEVGREVAEFASLLG